MRYGFMQLTTLRFEMKQNVFTGIIQGNCIRIEIITVPENTYIWQIFLFGTFGDKNKKRLNIGL